MFIPLTIIVSVIGPIGILFYTPFLIIFSIFIFPFYFVFKKIHSAVTKSIPAFESKNVNLFLTLTAHYGIPLLFAIIISNRFLLHFHSFLNSFPKHNNYFISFCLIALSLIYIALFDYIDKKISQHISKIFARFKTKKS